MTLQMHRNHGQVLSSCVAHAAELRQIHKTDVNTGDLVFIVTQNSLYRLRVAGSGLYSVSGGWFEQKGMAPVKTTIAGCTWGGSVIKVDVVAAVGLCLEFGNRVTTSPIQKIILLRHSQQN
jgi:hypothetical protein